MIQGSDQHEFPCIPSKATYPKLAQSALRVLNAGDGMRRALALV